MLISGPSLPYPLVALALLSSMRPRASSSDPISRLWGSSPIWFLFPLGDQLVAAVVTCILESHLPTSLENVGMAGTSKICQAPTVAISCP